MGLLKWTTAEIWCDFPKCYNSIRFEGNELKLIDWIKTSGWVAIRGFYFCREHSDKCILYIQTILANQSKFK